jgi:hypothetical protein
VAAATLIIHCPVENGWAGRPKRPSDSEPASGTPPARRHPNRTPGTSPLTTACDISRRKPLVAHGLRLSKKKIRFPRSIRRFLTPEG